MLRAQSSKFQRGKANTCLPPPMSFLPPNQTGYPIYSLHLPSQLGLCSYCSPCSSPSPLTFFLRVASPDPAAHPDRLEQTEQIALAISMPFHQAPIPMEQHFPLRSGPRCMAPCLHNLLSFYWRKSSGPSPSESFTAADARKVAWSVWNAMLP